MITAMFKVMISSQNDKQATSWVNLLKRMWDGYGFVVTEWFQGFGKWREVIFRAREYFGKGYNCGGDIKRWKGRGFRDNNEYLMRMGEECKYRHMRRHKDR